MEENKRRVLDDLADDIRRADIPEAQKNAMLKNFLRLSEQKTNLMITGATGCGKSSTINALFGMEKAKVGVGVDPETMDIQCYELENLILWDSPGLGDSPEADKRHTQNIVQKLRETDENGNLLIDLVLVILDGSSRDLGTSYDLITEVIIPNLGPDKKNRILVAINQADVAMKSNKHWDYENSMPDDVLIQFLDKKAKSVFTHIRDATGVEIEPIYYSAGYRRSLITSPSCFITLSGIRPKKNVWPLWVTLTSGKKTLPAMTDGRITGRDSWMKWVKQYKSALRRARILAERSEAYFMWNILGEQLAA